MRRRAAIVRIVLVAAALLAWRRRRARLRASLGAAPATAPPIASTPAAGRALTAPAPPPLPPPAAPPPPPDSRFVSVPWTLVAAPVDRAELTVGYAVPPRFQLDRVDAQETPTQVFVTVLLRPGAETAGGPTSQPETHEATVSLSGPLGSRALIHAPADPAASADDEPSGPPLYP